MQKLFTPVGSFLVKADDEVLYSLEWEERVSCKQLLPTSLAMRKWQEELSLYFQGKCFSFQTPFLLMGTPFQKAVWEAILSIPFGQTKSYQQLAVELGNPKAYRAVANACGQNPLPLRIPCHRVICTDGTLGGYRGGVMYKKWLLEQEQLWMHKSQQ